MRQIPSPRVCAASALASASAFTAPAASASSASSASSTPPTAAHDATARADDRRPHTAWIATLLGVVTVLALFGGRPAVAQNVHEGLPGIVAPTNRSNAATWYFRAIEHAGDLTAELDRIADWDYASLGDPPAEIRGDVARCKVMFDAMHRGARCDWCDWGLDYSQGFDLLLPHLAHMRSMARAMRADAVIRMNDGDSAAAAQAAATLDMLAHHASQDDILISSLVGMAIGGVSEDLKRLGFARGAFTPEDARAMARGLGRLPSSDAFRTTEAVIGEQMIFASYMRNEFRALDQRDAMRDAFSFVPDAELDQAASMSLEDFDAAVDDYESIMDEVVEAFIIEDPAAAADAIDAIEDRVEAGDVSVLTMMFMPSMGRVLERRHEVDAMLDARLAMLNDIAAGVADPAAAVDASVYYRRAIERVRTIDPEVLAALARGATAPDSGEDAAALAAWTDGTATRDEVVELLRRGAACTTFDAAMIGDGDRYRLLQPWVGGMRDCLRILLGEARVHARAGDALAARDHLTIACDVIADISSAESMLASRVAHEQFERTMSIGGQLPAGVAADEADAAGRDALRRASRSIGRSDPFGYVASTARLRRLVVSPVLRLWQRVEGDDVFLRREELDGPIKRSTGAGLFNVLLVLGVEESEQAAADALFGADASPAAEDFPMPAEVRRLVAAEELARLLASGRALRRAVVDRTNVTLADDATPDPFGLVPAMQRARRAYMQGLSVLAPLPPRDGDAPGGDADEDADGVAGGESGTGATADAGAA